MKNYDGHYLKNKMIKIIFIVLFKYKKEKKKTIQLFCFIKSFKNAYSITVTSSLTKNSTFSSSTFLRSESNSSVSISVIKQIIFFFNFTKHLVFVYLLPQKIDIIFGENYIILG